MKYFNVIIILCSLICTAYASDIYIAYNKHLAENLFKEYVKPNGEMLFTYVPRGLIISIDEDVFFEDCNEKIRQSSTKTLDEIGMVLNMLKNPCVIEGHTESVNPYKSNYKTNWELSLARANNITRYLMRCSKVSPELVTTLGFGEFMPFIDNVSKKAKMNNRIDFVIMHYEMKR